MAKKPLKPEPLVGLTLVASDKVVLYLVVAAVVVLAIVAGVLGPEAVKALVPVVAQRALP